MEKAKKIIKQEIAQRKLALQIKGALNRQEIEEELLSLEKTLINIADEEEFERKFSDIKQKNNTADGKI